MFKGGSHPIDVAIALNLRQKQVEEYYREYWDLNGLYILNQLYEEIKDVNAIWSISELYKQMKANGKTTAHAIRLLEISNNDISSVESIIEERKREEATLDFRIQRAAKIFQDFNGSILNEKKTLDQYLSEIRQLKQELDHLYLEKIKRENSMEHFQNNNETYTKIKQIVKQEIELIMTNPSRLLRFALASLFESSRKHPGKLQSLYYNMSTTDIHSLLRTSIVQNEHNPNQHGQDEAAPEKILLDEAEQVFSKLIDDVTGKYIDEITAGTKSIFQTEQVSGLQYDMSQKEDHHTGSNVCEVEIPASEVLSSFATRICESLKITHCQVSEIS